MYVGLCETKILIIEVVPVYVNQSYYQTLRLEIGLLMNAFDIIFEIDAFQYS